jgi:preprotein translocase subunit SecG
LLLTKIPYFIKGNEKKTLFFMLKQLITFVQVISAILLILVILLQQRGAGLGAAFGGGGEIFRTKRGVEKILFISTIILAILFFSSTLLETLLR